MNFTFATLLAVRAPRPENNRRHAGDRPRAMRVVHQPYRGVAGAGRASRPRAAWRICPVTGRPVLCWSAEPQGDGSRCRRHGASAQGRP